MTTHSLCRFRPVRGQIPEKNKANHTFWPRWLLHGGDCLLPDTSIRACVGVGDVDEQCWGGGRPSMNIMSCPATVAVATLNAILISPTSHPTTITEIQSMNHTIVVQHDIHRLPSSSTLPSSSPTSPPESPISS